MDVDDVAERIVVTIPHMLEEVIAGDNLIGIAQEVFKEAIFPQGQVDGFSVDTECLSAGIECQAFELQDIVAGERGATQEGSDACRQLFEGERLYHIVIGADVQSRYLVAYGVFGGQHEDRGGVACGA